MSVAPQLGATTVAQLRKVLPTLAADVAGDPYEEESLYRWSFRFCLTVSGRGCSPAVAACGCARLVVGSRTQWHGRWMSSVHKRRPALHIPCDPARQLALPADLHVQRAPLLQEPGQKIIDVDTAAQMLQLVLPQVCLLWRSGL